MVFSGGVSPEQARILIEKFFSDVSNAPYRFEKIRGRIPFHGLKQWKSDKFEQSHVALSVMLPEGVSEIETAAFLTALSGGFSSPLFDTVRNEMKIAYSIGASVQHVSRNPIFTFYGNTDEQKVLDLIRGCKIALVKLRNTPEREILRTRKSLLLSAARASSAIIGSPDELLFAYQRTGLFPPSAEEIAKFADNLSPEVFRNHAQMIIDLLPSAAVAIVGGQAQYSPENFSEECTKILSVG
jgi:predicted Zn-dependent peptidase